METEPAAAQAGTDGASYRMAHGHAYSVRDQPGSRSSSIATPVTTMPSRSSSALARPELELLAVTTVAGNAGLEATTRNALRVLTLVGPRRTSRSRPGRPDRSCGELHVAANVHGASGLEGADLPGAGLRRRVPEGAIELIRSILAAAAEPVTIAAVGPLTNIALLLRTHPELTDRIASIRIMGGAITEGNTTASAEFNIWQDPEAARIVLDCGRPITLMTLDVTHQALFTAADVERLEGLGTRIGAVFADLLRFFARFHAERYGWDGSPIHDAVAVAHLAVPDLVRHRALPRRRRDVQRADPRANGRRPPRADRQAAERRRRHRDRPDAVHRPADRGGRRGRGAREAEPARGDRRTGPPRSGTSPSATRTRSGHRSSRPSAGRTSSSRRSAAIRRRSRSSPTSGSTATRPPT